jgi:hypothetical protein
MDIKSNYVICTLSVLLLFTVTFVYIVLNRESLRYDCIYYNCTDIDFNNNTCNATRNTLNGSIEN